MRRLDEDAASELELDWDIVRNGVGGPLFILAGENEAALQEETQADAIDGQ